LAALFGAWRLQQLARRETPSALGNLSLLGLAQLLLVWGAAWWALALVSEVLRFVGPHWQSSALLLVLAASMASAASSSSSSRSIQRAKTSREAFC
jgi:hypothetical protein